MSKFQEMSFDGKCDVCGKETKVVDCVSSSMGAISYKYCEECLQKETITKVSYVLNRETPKIIFQSTYRLTFLVSKHHPLRSCN